MNATRIRRALPTVAVLLCVACSPAGAQFSPFVTLPSSDFTWHWGDFEEEKRRLEDFSVSGIEAGFRCNLIAQLSPGSRITDTDIRTIENELTGSLYFIQAAANAMNALDQQRELDWAELACVKPQATESDPQESAERVERAREKALQDMIERRERRERKENP